MAPATIKRSPPRATKGEKRPADVATMVVVVHRVNFHIERKRSTGDGRRKSFLQPRREGQKTVSNRAE